MSNLIGADRISSRIATIGGLVLASTLATSAAFAGGCPADKVKADVRAPTTFAAVGVTDTTLGAIDLEKEPAQIKDRQLRFRKLTIAPNGVVPWHSHGDRPALIFVAEGEIVEYASNCEVPIVHKAGDLASRDQRHLALVEESRQQDRGALCRRSPPRWVRQEHVSVAPPSALHDAPLARRGVFARANRRHTPCRRCRTPQRFRRSRLTKHSAESWPVFWSSQPPPF